MTKIPNKSLFKIDEVCTIVGIKPYVLRFWESEFEQINPIMSSLGQKLYSTKDVELISHIKKLLFEEKMPVEKAKSLMLTETEKSFEQSEGAHLTNLFMAKKELQKLLNITGAIKQQHNWYQSPDS